MKEEEENQKKKVTLKPGQQSHAVESQLDAISDRGLVVDLFHGTKGASLLGPAGMGIDLSRSGLLFAHRPAALHMGTAPRR
jgi:hypothetical protein